MKAMVLQALSNLADNPTLLSYVDLPEPAVGAHDILVRVVVCGVCHTELDEIEGRTPPSHFPIVLGHQVIGQVVATGTATQHFQIGDRVGVAWIYSACGQCQFCQRGQENLCAAFQASGRDVHGGYAEYMTVPEAFAYPIPAIFTDVAAAPLLCAGAIGYRSLKLSGLTNGQRLGLTGFGASAHLVLKLVRYRYPATQVFVFARSPQERAFALELGAAWAWYHRCTGA